MNAVFALGRFLLAATFIVSGIQKLMDVSGTAEALARTPVPAWMPPVVSDTAVEIATAVGLGVPQLLAIIVGLIALICGLLVAFNLLTRTSAVVLILYTAVATYYSYDFWSGGAQGRWNNFTQALNNLAIIGGLLMLAALPRWLWAAEPEAYYPETHEPVIRERQIGSGGTVPGA
jgi:putative oxidoreductase